MADKKKVDKKPSPKKTSKPQPKAINQQRSKAEARPKATEMMREFLKRTGIELYTTDMVIETVSDGSTLIKKPSILARYKDGKG